MRRIKLVIQYDGGNFCGWQEQKKGERTVQVEIENAFKKAFNKEIKLTASGRTDSGVHAYRQVAHFDTDITINEKRFAYAINSFLDSDVKVLSSVEVDENFSARFSAKNKTYVYKMYKSNIPLPLYDKYALRIDEDIDISIMQKACEYLIGKHDFKCFLASGSNVKDTVREVYFASITAYNDIVEFEICGNGFLYNMVRIIVGTLLDIAKKKLEPSKMEEIISSKNRKFAGKTASSHGLYLKNVIY